MRQQLVRLARRTPLEHLRQRYRMSQALREGNRRGSFAQGEEDRFVKDYFDGKPGRYLDIGANHPFHLSNTYLLYQAGWTGVTFEPIRHLYQEHRRLRPRDTGENCAVGAEAAELTFYVMNNSAFSTFDPQVVEKLTGEGMWLKEEIKVPIMPIAEVAEKHGQDGVHLLSLDTEGHDIVILRAFPWDRLRPKLLICEQANAEDAEGVESRNIIENAGYRELHRTTHNTIFVDDRDA